MAESVREVRLSSELCKAAEERYAAQFGSLEQFLEFVMQTLVRDDAAQMDQSEQRVIEERLKALGYI
jgi:hypothetical protein